MGEDYKETSDKEEPWRQNTSVLEQALVMGRGELSSQYQSSSSEVTKTNRFGNHVGGKEKWAFFCVVGHDLCTTCDRTAYTQVRPMPLMPFSSECPLDKLCLPILGHREAPWAWEQKFLSLQGQSRAPGTERKKDYQGNFKYTDTVNYTCQV